MPLTGAVIYWNLLQAKGELHLEVTYKPFEDDDTDSGYREAEAYALLLQQQAITDVKVSFLHLASITLCLLN